MTLKLDEIVKVDAPSRVAPRMRKHGMEGPYTPTRRGFLKAATATAMGVGLSALGVFPLARRAAATHPNNSIWQGCSGLGTGAQDDDCRGCEQDRELCCCGGQGWHWDELDGAAYRHRPNMCKDGTYDGWTWSHEECCPNFCRLQEWRCHDGYKIVGGAWNETICRHRLGATCTC
jgi:hypothetical protein